MCVIRKEEALDDGIRVVIDRLQDLVARLFPSSYDDTIGYLETGCVDRSIDVNTLWLLKMLWSLKVFLVGGVVVEAAVVVNNDIVISFVVV